MTDRSTWQLAVLVVGLTISLSVSGCIGGEDYTVSVSDPETGEVFGEVTEAQIETVWSTYASVEIRYSVNDSWFDASGNWTGPGRNGTDPENGTSVRVERVHFDNGTANVRGVESLPARDSQWHGEFGVPVSDSVRKFQVRAVAGETVIDAVNVTVREQ